MSQRLVVVYEASADFTTATELADRELVDVIDWLDESLLDSQRQWVGESPDRRKLIWTSIDDLARERGMIGFRIAGHFGNQPAQPDAKAARRAIHVLRDLFGDEVAIVLIRDADDQGDRRRGLEQARQEHPKLPIVIGLAVPMREAWVLCGFEPASNEESKRLAAERGSLVFDPREKSQDLTARDQNAKKSPKRVLAMLTSEDKDRQRQCWLTTPLHTLKERGAHNGLAAYLGEVRAILAPLIAGHAGRP